MQSFLLALAVILSCDLCDSVGGTGWGGLPYRYSPFQGPACTEPDRLTNQDSWPKAGELRRNDFTRDCVSVELKRSFVAADQGFAPGELYALAGVTSLREGKQFRQLRHTEFIGVSDGKSYRYAVSLTPEGSVRRIAASVDAGVVSSRLIAASLDSVAQAGVRVLYDVTCEARDQICEIWRTRDSNIGQPAIFVRFDDTTPNGNMCFEAPLRLGNSAIPAVALSIEGQTLATLRNEGAAPFTCLGGDSANVLEALNGAKKLVYAVQRGDGKAEQQADRIEIDGDGLKLSFALAKYLRGMIGESDAGERTQRLEAEANTYCKGFPGGTC